jgi:hypothetical protein
MIRRFVFIMTVFIFPIFTFAKSLEGLDQLFPASGSINGWKWEGKPVHYSPDNLYELIDGEAELYLAYGFQELAALTYSYDKNSDVITVHLYNMGTPENAFGVYSNYRFPDYDFQAIGAEAMVSDYGIKFYQGPYFVDVSFGSSEASTQKAGIEIAKAISGAISDPAIPPSIIQLLPAQNQVDKTARYFAKEMLNQSFLPAGLEAKYMVGDHEVTGFVVICENPDQANAGIEKLKQFYESSDATAVEANVPGEKGFAVETAYQGIFMASKQDQYLAGVRELETADEGILLLQEILAQLKRE